MQCLLLGETKEDAHSAAGKGGWWSDQGPGAKLKRTEVHAEALWATVSVGGLYRFPGAAVTNNPQNCGLNTHMCSPAVSGGQKPVSLG